MSIAGSKSNHRDARPEGGDGDGVSKRKRAPAAARSRAQLNFTIPSDFTAGRDVQKQIMERVEQCRFDSQSVFAIKLALEEALINAIKHGNKLDPRKKVQIEAKVTPKKCEIEIEDQGPGFERCGVPDPTAEENL